MTTWRRIIIVVAVIVAGLVALQNVEYSYLRKLSVQVVITQLPAHQPEEQVNTSVLPGLPADVKKRLQELEEEAELLKDIINAKKFGWGDCLKMNHRTSCNDIHRSDPSVLPCQAEVMYDLIMAMDEALTEAGVIHWYAFGTLLGARRNGTIIPWTSDADLVYMRENRTQPDYRQDVAPKVQYHLYKKGILTFHDSWKHDLFGFGRACIGSHNKKYMPYINNTATGLHYMMEYPSLDLFGAKEAEGHPDLLWVWPCGGCHFRLKHSIPVGKIAFYNTTITAPHDVNKTLISTYGPPYMLPPPRITGHADNSYECDRKYLELPGMD